jgi:phosphoenolpyruvate carboxykinase (GTP)
MAMLPFCGYHMADYWQHWLNVGKRGSGKMPRVFHVNWFRKSADGKWLWPGFGANMRVLRWIVERVRGDGDALETPIGYLPPADALDTSGLPVTADAMRELLTVASDEWLAEAKEHSRYFRLFDDRLPEGIAYENAALQRRLTKRQGALVE